jgi:hypothetical protein
MDPFKESWVRLSIPKPDSNSARLLGDGRLAVDSAPANINTPVGWTTLVSDNWEGGALGAWTVYKGGGATDAVWEVTNYRAHSGSYCVYATGGGTQGVDAPGPYPQNCSTFLMSPTLNLASYEAVYVELWFYAKFGAIPSDTHRGLAGMWDFATSAFMWGDSLYVRYTGDATADPTTASGWRRVLYRLYPAWRRDNVNAVFYFQSDTSASAEGLYVDDIRIVGTTDVDTEYVSNDTYASRQYELKNSGQIAGLGGDSNDMCVPEAWGLVSVSPDVVVAVIDEGVDLTHPDLNLVQGYDYTGAEGGGPKTDEENHGTACAGNAGAIGNNGLGVVGTAPGVKIMPIYLNFGGSTYADIANAIDLAVEHGAKVLSNSWG